MKSLSKEKVISTFEGQFIKYQSLVDELVSKKPKESEYESKGEYLGKLSYYLSWNSVFEIEYQIGMVVYHEYSKVIKNCSVEETVEYILKDIKNLSVIGDSTSPCHNLVGQLRLGHLRDMLCIINGIR